MSRVQIRGVLLEEALLFLLRRSGYKTVDTHVDDPTLCRVGAGLAVCGRGTEHQIDAIADYEIQQPFSHPQRLLVEAKCYDAGRKVALPVIRNALGVLRDVSEHFVSNSATAPKCKRFHYQYAVFSPTGYTKEAQRYAFAQDIYLIRVAESHFFQPVIAAIRTSADLLADGGGLVLPPSMEAIRSRVRHLLMPAPQDAVRNAGAAEKPLDDAVRGLVAACHRLGFALMIVAAGRFPILLVPSELVHAEGIQSEYRVQIWWNKDGWYLRRDGELLFAFSIPQELLSLYEEAGVLRALDLKKQAFSEFRGLIRDADGLRMIRFRIDGDWLSRLPDPRME